ncbi:hypothetical protein [Prolixibacter sp. NT017]|uniref:hypothetical protein n=1 Tax=Prolixibacter sp. NT017 TaxID=2652390 RepID=UPI001286CD94|nr:hypothetical protein [Prolixibacter sp. NT017]GET26068.1 hypothetical protein NT017_23970 [Prolixibacter sp. NT017]
MKRLILVLLVVFSVHFGFGQEKNNIVFMMEGECHVVLNHIRRQVQNDSLSVQYFLKNYKIIDNRIANIRKKDFKDVVRLLNLPENEDLFCVWKSDYHENTLLRAEPDSAKH